MTPVAGAPSFTTERTWRVDPQERDCIAFDAVENAIAVEGSGGWVQSELPQPSATEVRPYVQDIESNGTTLLAVSAWGIHRSLDGGMTLAARRDRRRAAAATCSCSATAGSRSSAARRRTLFDARAPPPARTPSLVVGRTKATVCEDGTIVARNKLTHDLGATWQALIAAAICDDDRQARRLRRHRPLLGARDSATRGAIGSCASTRSAEPASPPATGTRSAIRRGRRAVRRSRALGDGTFLVAGLALAPGATRWTLQRDRRHARGRAATTLFGVAKQQFYASHDGGVTWAARRATGLAADEPEAFARSADGTLYVSQFTGDTDRWPRHVALGRLEERRPRRDVDAGVRRHRDARGRRRRRDPGRGRIASSAITDDRRLDRDRRGLRDGGMTWQKTTVLGDQRARAPHARTARSSPAAPTRSCGACTTTAVWATSRATYQIVVDGKSIPASQLRSVAFDEDGYAYVARGTPHAQIWRSNRPLARARVPLTRDSR